MGTVAALDQDWHQTCLMYEGLQYVNKSLGSLGTPYTLLTTRDKGMQDKKTAQNRRGAQTPRGD
jgi:hypothetical protein